MSSINKISIKGIRSFSPSDEEQIVEFMFPLTIITGMNGCGKTTIIESLKFAMSGSLPPGGATRSAGQNFLYDPRALAQPTVKGSVKLRFTNKAGKGMVVIRSMELTQKKSTMQFKQLDGIIRTMDAETGERVSLSHKCSELDKQVPHLLGVSKAILDYVLFVHQEESSWPLQEASVLKKRFDDIFDSTRYTKALESFRKTKKELNSQAKDIKADVAGLTSSKHAAVIFRKDLDEQNKSLEKLEGRMAEAEQQKKEAQEEDERCIKILDAVKAVESKLKHKKTALLHLESKSETQKNLLEEDLTETHTMDELIDKKENFDKEMQKAKKQKEKITRKVQAIEEEMESIREEQLKLESSKGKLAAEKDAHEKRLLDRQAMMKKIDKAYGLDLQSSMTQYSRIDDSFSMSQTGTSSEPSRFSKADMDSFFKSLEDKEEELKEQLDKHKKKLREDEKEANSALQELEGQKIAYEKEKVKLNSETKDIDRQLRALDQKIGSKRTKKTQITALEERMNEAARELDKLVKDDKRNNLAAEVKNWNNALESNKENIEKNENSRNRLKSSARLQQRIDMMQEAVVQDALNLQESVEKQRRKMTALKVPLPEALPKDTTIAREVDKVCGSIEGLYEEAKEKAANARNELDQAKNEQSDANLTLKATQETISTTEAKINKLSQGSKSVLGRMKRIVGEMKEHGLSNAWSIERGDPQEVRGWLEEHLEELQEDDPADINLDILKVLEKRLRKEGKSSGKCPCCARSFSGDEQDRFVDAVKKLRKEGSCLVKGVDPSELREWKDKMQQHEGWVKEFERSEHGLSEFRAATKDLSERRVHLQNLENLFKGRKQNTAAATEKANAAEQSERDFRDLLEMAKRWRSDAGRIEEQESNVEQKKEQLTCETAGTAGEQTLEGVEEELDRLREEQAELYDKISKQNKAITHANEEISNAQAIATKTANLFREKQQKFKEEQDDLQKRDELLKRKSKISLEVEKAAEQVTGYQQKIKTKEGEKNRILKSADIETEKLSNAWNDFLAEKKQLTAISRKIDDYEGGDNLERIESEVASLLEKVEEKKKEKEELLPDLKSATKAVDDQARHESVLQQNIDLLATLDEMAKMNEGISAQKAKKNDIEGHDTAERLSLEAQEQISRCEVTLSNLKGRRSEIVEQIRSLNRKLASEEYRDIDDRHRAELIKLETTQLAIKDIDNYANALDKALLRFHGLKIAEINKIVKELWLLTYKGEDITNIELESGQDSRAAKSYNYRVVMTKGNTKMDMRGRCSAGQRVLASLVIRLALAETFGVQLGCLVLDEPTVNLDESNRKGLAVAMAQIIASRSKQVNFQLVLITHDEDFISLMKDELSSQTGVSMPEKFFRVHREEATDGKYYSKIDAEDWDTLL